MLDVSSPSTWLLGAMAGMPMTQMAPMTRRGDRAHPPDDHHGDEVQRVVDQEEALG